MGMQVRRAGIWDAEALADVAAATFPLACPPDATAVDIAAFVADVLSVDRFADYLADPNRVVLTASDEASEGLAGYAMLVLGEPYDPRVAEIVTARPTIELSKFYVVGEAHGTGVAAQLMAAVLDFARERDAASVWLGVNQRNERAQRFYAKHGFRRVGTKTFHVGTQLHEDFVMEHALRG